MAVRQLPDELPSKSPLSVVDIENEVHMKDVFVFVYSENEIGIDEKMTTMSEDASAPDADTSIVGPVQTCTPVSITDASPHTVSTNAQPEFHNQSKSASPTLGGDAGSHGASGTNCPVTIEELCISALGSKAADAEEQTSSMIEDAMHLPTVPSTERLSTLKDAIYKPIPDSPSIKHTSTSMENGAIDAHIPRSPTPEHIPYFTTLEPVSTGINTRSHHRSTHAYKSKRPHQNPYIKMEWVCGFLMIGRRKRSKKPRHSTVSGTATSLENNAAKPVVNNHKKREKVGPYRSAAVWEFIGKTFDKGRREKSRRKRKKGSARMTAPFHGLSNLSKEVFPDEEDIEMEQGENELEDESGMSMDED